MLLSGFILRTQGFFRHLRLAFLFIAVSAIAAPQNSVAIGANLIPPGESLALEIPDDVTATNTCRLVSSNEFLSKRKVDLRRTFLDDFDTGSEPDVRWLKHYYRPGNPYGAHTHDGADEEVTYVDKDYAGTGSRPLRLNPFEVHNGLLTINAFRVGEGARSALFGRPYASGMLISRNFFAQRYGYFEIAAKLPASSVVWPAFWLVPKDKPTPPELDVVELIGKEPDHIYQTTHWTYPAGHAACRTDEIDVSLVFHSYGALWTPKYIIYYIDRRAIGIISTPESMDVPMYMIINLGVGGAWPGHSNAASPDHFVMDVDWVAAYVLQ